MGVLYHFSRSASAKSPEYLKAMHEALMQIDDGTLVDNFCNEAEDLVAADKSYLKFYPYLEFVAPLEKATRELDVSLSQKTFYAMKRDKVPYNPKDERKYRRKFFEADNCLSKYNAILDKVKAAEATVRNEDALERLKKLKLGIMRSINDN